MFFNGSASAGLTITLTGTVAAGDVYVVANGSANATILALADQTNSSSWFNGDDAIVLRKGTTVIDAIGQVGFDPGTEWGTSLTSTGDNTLRRKSSICAGDPNGGDAFDPAVEWDGYALDTFAGLGAYSTCGSPGPTGVGAANPTSSEPGRPTLLTVTVTPGAIRRAPASPSRATSPRSAARRRRRSSTTGTNGDVTAGDNVFSYQATVAGGTTAGNKTLPVTVADAQARSSSASISAGRRPADRRDPRHPGIGLDLAVRGTARADDRHRDGRQEQRLLHPDEPGFEDADPSTSEGVFVFTSSAPPPAAAASATRSRSRGRSRSSSRQRTRTARR